MHHLQGPVAIGSFIFAEDDAGRLLRVLRALPYPRAGARVRVDCLEVHPGILAAVRDLFGQSVALSEISNPEFHDEIVIAYQGSPCEELPSSMVSVRSIGRLPGPPVVTVAWGSERKDRDIQCDDVVAHYLHLAAETQCLCSALSVEQEILRIEDQFVWPVTDACAATYQNERARHGETGFESIVGEIRRSLRTIAGSPCVVE